MGKILITGATGNLGSLTIHHLLTTRKVPANKVIGLVRSIKNADKLSKLGIELRTGSYDDLESLKVAFTDVEKILIISSPELDNVKRLQQQLNVVRAAKESKIKHIHLVSLADAENRVFDLEDVDMATEHMIRATNIPYTFLQNGVYFDEIRYDINSAIKNKKLISATKNQKFNYVLRNDLALVNATVLSENNHQNKTYKLVNNELTTYKEIANILTDITGTSIPYLEKNKSEVAENLIKFGLPEEYAEPFVEMFQGSISEKKFESTSDDIVKLIGNKKTSLKDSINFLIEK